MASLPVERVVASVRMYQFVCINRESTPILGARSGPLPQGLYFLHMRDSKRCGAGNFDHCKPQNFSEFSRENPVKVGFV